MTTVNAIIQGILLGGLYALFACGLSLMFGVMRIANLAHGDLAVLGAFMVSTLATHAGMSAWVALIIVLPGAAVVGFALQRGILDRALRAGELPPILATFGLAIVIQNALLEIFTADSRSIDAGPIQTASWSIGDQITIPKFGVLVLVIAVLVLGSLQLFLSRNRFGRQMRATADDLDTAGLVGIDAKAIYATAAAIAVATAALAGTFFAMRSTFEPTSGPTQLIFAFEAVAIGGLGSIWGTLAGGIILGVTQAVVGEIDPAYAILSGHLLFLAVLAFRPRGIFAARQVRA
jgi:branched-chain amino acid transport system permease protein